MSLWIAIPVIVCRVGNLKISDLERILKKLESEGVEIPHLKKLIDMILDLFETYGYVEKRSGEVICVADSNDVKMLERYLEAIAGREKMLKIVEVVEKTVREV